MSDTPRFPPLMAGVAAIGENDPFETACAMAVRGCEGGTVVHKVQADRLRAAIIFAPEVATEKAIAMLPLCGVGFQNAVGALAPPEVAVHLDWSGGIRVNGAHCGRLRVAAADAVTDQVPDWLVVGLEVPILQTECDPGTNPDVTALYEEGCAEVDPAHLLESWARHCLVWINRWSDEGNAPVHAAWSGLLQGIGETVTRAGICGTFLGADERFGMLIRNGETTHLVPMSNLLGESE
ncbi:biotin/lipoate--protein ligase family protein [Sedimentitalea todarodis]|uniref:DUF4444 domain-containing protein n=1 Tax=Sedimentitalea todarodis TaxID=1631240 RepID=A0ABU3VEK4_9RHOB|nr:DUF4444 domain-containing protein [Sedimentitalea todarodis]MDU9004611.1 DUF4444 domain-containing protein [Sedimentitalea todarodis]